MTKYYNNAKKGKAVNGWILPFDHEASAARVAKIAKSKAVKAAQREALGESSQQNLLAAAAAAAAAAAGDADGAMAAAAPAAGGYMEALLAAQLKQSTKSAAGIVFGVGQSGNCPWPGCNGFGNLDPLRATHNSAGGCPLAKAAARKTPNRCPFPGCKGEGSTSKHRQDHRSVSKCPMAKAARKNGGVLPDEMLREEDLANGNMAWPIPRKVYGWSWSDFTSYLSRWGLTAAQKNKARSRYKEIKEEPKVKAAPGSKEAAAEAAAAKKKKMRMNPKKRRKWKAPKPPRMTELISRLAPISSKDAPSNEEMKKYAEKVLQWSAVYASKVPLFIVPPTDEEWERQLDEEEAALEAKRDSAEAVLTAAAKETASTPKLPKQAATAVTAASKKKKKKPKKDAKGSKDAAPSAAATGNAAPSAAATGTTPDGDGDGGACDDGSALLQTAETIARAAPLADVD